MKLKANDLLFEACLCARLWHESTADAEKSSDPEEAEKSNEFIRQLKAYMIKRWGEWESPMEKHLHSIKIVSLAEIANGPDTEFSVKGRKKATMTPSASASPRRPRSG